MAEIARKNVTMRVRIGESEIEVTGSAKYVDEKIEDFIKKFKVMTDIPRKAGKNASGDLTSTIPGSGKKQSLAQFLKSLPINSDNDRALAAGYFLEKQKNFESFTASDIREVISKDAKRRPPKNPSDAVAQNVKKGFMMPAGDKDSRKAYVLTTDGEEYIEQMAGG